jgi:hypothetical protein
MENQNIVRWGAGSGAQKENFAIFFANQIYQSTIAELPSAYVVLRSEIEPDAWYRLNETSGIVVTDEINAEVGSTTETIVQNALIIDYTEDTGSLAMTSGNSFSVPNSIPISWNADSNTVESIWVSFWVTVDSLASQIDVFESNGDPTKFNVKINTNGSVTFKINEFSGITSVVGAVVVGVPTNISWWTHYDDFDFTFSNVKLRYQVAGVASSGSSGSTYASTRFPDLTLGGFTVGKFDGEVDELLIRYGNEAGGNTISQAEGIAWNQGIYDLQN